MTSRLRERTRTTTIRDLVGEDARVVCVEGFRPNMSQEVDRGRYFLLSDPIVRAWPMYFAVCVPVSDVLEIER